MKNKCVIVIGPESSGTLFISRIIVHALGIRNSVAEAKFGNYGSLENDTDRVYHISLPTSPKAVFMDIAEIIEADRKQFKEVYVVICTRDITISEKSRLKRMTFRTSKDVKLHSEKARIIINGIMENFDNWFLWSYETFMFLQNAYLEKLYKFIGVNGKFEFLIEDGNKKYIK